MSSLTSDTVDLAMIEGCEFGVPDNAYTFRHIHQQFGSEPVSHEPLGYRWTHLKCEERPDRIRKLRPPNQIDKLDVAKVSITKNDLVLRVACAAVFTVIFIFFCLLQITEEEISAFGTFLNGLSGLERHATVVNIYLGLLALVYVDPCDKITCLGCKAEFKNSSSCGMHWRNYCGWNGFEFRCVSNYTGCGFKNRQIYNVKKHALS
ncbi:uncharacterized protein F4822DRAFT_443071 [Hypoxylon trugodes]|uniref:uncharacterized protein n=1 Tax=Hypoxylon trugodes TaxID=326681 RepID=UPI00219D1989|nr:uncharacterized protein F4822DRAFT_443071 [Hypoxylon trugodes]KAI1390060.1 hypothetical protein F4822DRAFT_443071 [Hypoxylon trugodes]